MSKEICPICHEDFNYCPHMLEEAFRYAEDLRKQLKVADNIIIELLSYLPDSNHIDECWSWCWDELNGDAQDAVKDVRDKAKKALAKIERLEQK
jgi:hypothetical protein